MVECCFLLKCLRYFSLIQMIKYIYYELFGFMKDRKVQLIFFHITRLFMAIFKFRSISRVYLSSGEEPVGGGRGWRREGEEPRLTSWRRTHDESLLNSSNTSSLLRRGDGHDSFSKDSSLPSYTSETNLPPIPARRPSAVGDSAPNRPPKPNRSNNNTDDEDSKKDKDSNNSDSSIWYEYGCV